VDDGVAAVQGRPQRLGPGQVPHVGVARYALEVGQAASPANQQAQHGALRRQRKRHVVAHKPRSAR